MAESPARFLHSTAKENGVTTMWLKDLGYTVEAGADGWELVSPDYPEELKALAHEALAEIMACTKVVNTPDGVALQMPTDAALWIAKVAREWAGTRGG